MASRILSQDEARARRGPMEGPQRVNNEALAEEDAASTTDPIESFRLRKREMECSTPLSCELNPSSALNGAEELGGIGT